MASGEPTTMPALVGRPLPPFDATDRLGTLVSSDELVRGKLSLLLPFADGNAMPMFWGDVDRAIGRFDAGLVNAYAIYTGSRQGDDAFAAFDRPKLSERGGWRTQPTVLHVTDRPLPLPRRSVYLVDSDGIVQATFPLRGARDLETPIVGAITRLMRGEPVARQDADAVSHRVEERRQRRSALEAAFREDQRRWSGHDNPPAASKIEATTHETHRELPPVAIAEAAVMSATDREGPQARARSLRQQRALRARAANIDLSNEPGLTRGGAAVIPEIPELPPRVRREARDVSPEERTRSAGAARRILADMAAFIGSHQTVEFTTRYTILEQGTNGMVTDELDTEFAFALPDRFMFTTPGNAAREPGVVRSDGAYVIRSAGEMMLAEPAASSLVETLRSALVTDDQPWSLDAERLLMLMTQSTIPELLDGSSSEHVGSGMVAGTPVHHLRITTGGVQPGGRGFGWDLFVTADDRPRPLVIVLDFDGLFPHLAARERYSESSIIFSDWRFDRPGCEQRLVHRVNENNTLASSLEELNGFDLRPLNPMIGRVLPEFTGIDRGGNSVDSRELYADGPAVITFWSADYLTLLYMQPALNELRERYEESGVRVVSIHPGDSPGIAEIDDYMRTHDIGGEVLTTMTNVEDFRDGAACLFFYSFTPTYYELGEVLQTFVVGTDGRIHGVHDLLPRKPYRDIKHQIDRLLEGHDVASDAIRAIEHKAQRRAQLLARLRDLYGGS